MTTPTTIPAGWYPDPAGRHEYRYWSGAEWTRNVADHGVREVEIPAPRAAPDETLRDTGTRPTTPAAPAAPSTPATPAVSLTPTRPAYPSGPGHPIAPAEQEPGRPGRRGGARTLVIVGVAVAAVIALVVGLLVWAPWASNVPDAPAGVRATLATETSARVEWAEPDGGPTVERYLIRRDGEQVGSVKGTETEYVDSDLTSASTYRYTVVADSAEGPSEPSSEVVLSTTAPVPTGLTVVASTPRTVLLRWRAPSTGTPPESYQVLRDGNVVDTVDGDTTRFRDDGLVPGSRHAYAVAAVWGEESSDASPTVPARTQLPPLSTARLAGMWTVRTKIDHAGGGSVEVGDTFTDTWRIRPTCGSGACDAVVTGTIGGSVYTQASVRVPLERRGGTYSGSAKATLTHCGAIDVENDVTVRITLKQGRMSGDSWEASRWRGTVNVHSPYTQASATTYCPDQSFGGSLAATR